ncbi:MAG: leucine-rich repeat domain-containing protein [Candidatus Methanomethylophilaceae archaeon]
MPLLAAFMIVLGIIAIGFVLADDSYSLSADDPSDEFEYVIKSAEDKTVEITEYKGSSPNLEIPESVKIGGVDYTVVSIESYTFYSDSFLETITIPASVTSVPQTSLKGCTSLTSITVADGNPKYSSDNGVMFSSDGTELLICPAGKTGSYQVPDDVKAVGVGAFSTCVSLTSISIPETVTSIGYSAFSGCESLTSISFPENISSLGGYLFDGCISLESFTISDNVTSIGNYTFSRCKSLTSITIPAGVTSIGSMTFSGCDSLTAINVADGNPEYLSDNGVLIEKSTMELMCCPAGKTGGYEIPDGIKVITASSFEGCASLTSVVIPDSVTSIEMYAFNRCTSLTSVSIPGVTEIGQNAFSNCTSMESVKISGTAKYIRAKAFYGCTSLTSVSISSGVMEIGPNAFSYCASLGSLEIPATVTSIGMEAFSHCTSLTAIKVDSDNKYYSSDAGVLFNKTKTSLIRCPEKMEGSYEVPDSVSNIEAQAFRDCVSLESIEIPDTVSSMGSMVFVDCTSLKSVTLSTKITEIKSYMFSGCSSLTSIEIPAGVTSIGSSAFNGCHSLTAINVDEGNKSYHSDASGVLFDVSVKELIFCPQGMTGDYTIPDSVTTIGSIAFYEASLTSVTIPAGVTEIGTSTFYGCSSLISIYVDEGNETYRSGDGGLFIKEHNILIGYTGAKKEYAIPSDIKISPSVFAYSSTERFILPADMKVLSYCMFDSCSNLRSIVVTGDYSELTVDYAFYDCPDDFVFESGRDGYTLNVYSDPEMKTKITADDLGNWNGTLYLEWVEVHDNDDNTVLIVVGSVGAVAVIGAGAFILLRRRV